MFHIFDYTYLYLVQNLSVERCLHILLLKGEMSLLFPKTSIQM